MFLSALSYKQRKIFLGLAKEILTIDDGVIDHLEENYLRSICAEMSLSYNDAENVERNELKGKFSDIESQRILLVELVALGYCNSVYHEKQNQYTDDIAGVLGIPIAELRNIEGMMNDFKKIQNSFIGYISAEKEV